MDGGSRRNLILCFTMFCLRTLAIPLEKMPEVAQHIRNEPRKTDFAIFRPSEESSIAFLWSSIGIATFTAFLQGLVTTLASMTESSNSWTFRFRLAKLEHWWWTVISVFLFISLVLITLSFASGNNNEAISILVLSSTTLLAIVQYTVPSWRSRHYIRNRYSAWAGPSRTAIKRDHIAYCGSKRDWTKLSKNVRVSDRKRTPSDDYGWHIWRVEGIREDPTDMLNSVHAGKETISREGRNEHIYQDGYQNSATVSLFWGEQLGFVPRVSRAISSVPANLLKSRPITVDGFAGEGLCLGMGILGRNKGLNPKGLVFKMNEPIWRSLENNSAFAPRPSKTLRSYYAKQLKRVYGGISDQFVLAAVELSLILMDADSHAIATWLEGYCEHQYLYVNQRLQQLDATPEELKAHYESSYVSMVISLNNMRTRNLGRPGRGIDSKEKPCRPDIICLGLLLKAREQPEPNWWRHEDIQAIRESERTLLNGEWYNDAAKLLGLSSCPHGFENGQWGIASPSLDSSTASTRVVEMTP
jgi:hypothetical protein